MSRELNGLFSEAEHKETAAGARSLEGTAQLTNVSSTIANNILKIANDNFDEYKELIAKSKSDHSAMDALIAKAYELKAEDGEFLKELDDKTIEGMLKSQQSKRSRTKSKIMTMDNYRTMLVGAVAENLIRLATDKPKQSVGSKSFGKVEFTAEDLEELANDQDRLRKEIRNVQSKKSIMKSKEGFSEEDEKWQALLVAEAQLKGLRVDTVRTITVDTTKQALSEMFDDVDVANMKASDAKKLLELVGNLLKEDE